MQIPITYDPAATCPSWEEYIEPCFSEDAPTLPYEIFASVITPYKATQKAALLLGEGSNGKSTYLAAVMRGLGRANCTSVTLQALETNRFASARLVGKLANICADLPSTHLQETSVFKALTGDEGQITAEYKHKDSFEFEPYCQLVFSANHPPRSSDASHAFFRRWVVAPFDRTFEEGAQLPREELDRMLAAPGELSGMLNKALDALPGLRRNGFTESQKMRAAWEELRSMTDPVSVWIFGYAVVDKNAYVPKQELRAAYNEYAQQQNHQTLTDKSFTQSLKRALPGIGEGQRTINGDRKHCWVGVGLKSDPGPPAHPGSAQGAQGAQGSLNCNEKASTSLQDPISGGLCSKEEPVHPVHPVHEDGAELLPKALAALRHEGSGPAKTWEAYASGRSSTFEYVVRAVAHYHGDGERWERWRAPVTLAVEELGERGAGVR